MASRRPARRFYVTDCLNCSAMCQASDRSADAHRMWAQRHVEKHPTHTVHVTAVVIRAYKGAEADD